MGAAAGLTERHHAGHASREQGALREVRPHTVVELRRMMDRLGHTYIDYLKIDCEGCEWALFEALEKYDPTFLSSVGQLAIEVHMNVDPATGTPLEGTSTDLTLERLTTFISHLTERHGFVVAARELNTQGMLRMSDFSGLLPSSLVAHHQTMATGPRGLNRTSLWAFWNLLFLRP